MPADEQIDHGARSFSDLVIAELLASGCDCGASNSIYSQLKPLLDELAYAPDVLKPAPTVNRTLNRLVEICTKRFGVAGNGNLFHEKVIARISESMRAPELRERGDVILRAACIAEGAMEKHYAAVIRKEVSTFPELDGLTDPVAKLQVILGDFPYLKNYEYLVSAEVATLESLGAKVDAVGFCGCGPLPISAVLFQLRTGCKTHLIDNDKSAIVAASQFLDLLAQCGVIERCDFTVTLADASEVKLSEVDVVVAAASVSSSDTTALAANHASHDRCNILVARTAEELAGYFCYQPVDHDAVLQQGWRYLGASRPDRLVNQNGRDETIVRADSSVLNTTKFFAT